MSRAATSTLDVERLSVGYGGRRVVEDLTLTGIRGGEVTALVGPNAAGKSTLLRALAGLVPARGSVRLGNVDLARLDLAARATRIGFMPQSLPAGLSLGVLESLLAALRASPFGGYARPLSDRAAREIALAQLDRIGIASLALEPLDRLSGGQRQLVGLAQAVVRGPELLLLDEPTSALDLRHQHRVMRIVREIAGSGTIVVAVLHDLSLAAQFADRLVMLGHGRVRADGPPAAALTPERLRETYGIEARVERCSLGRLQIMVDGEADSSDENKPT